jgi:hypothetical protein
MPPSLELDLGQKAISLTENSLSQPLISAQENPQASQAMRRGTHGIGAWWEAQALLNEATAEMEATGQTEQNAAWFETISR